MSSRRLAFAGSMALLALAVGAGSAEASKPATINAGVDAAIKQCYGSVAGCEAVAEQAKGVLVFPEVTRAGVGIGGSYGVGALQVDGKTVGYYSTTGASIGLQAGAEKHAEVIMFLTDEALARFVKSTGWQVGGDASVTVIDEGSSSNIDTLTENHPVVAFVYGEKGLMGALALEGTKISPYVPD